MNKKTENMILKVLGRIFICISLGSAINSYFNSGAGGLLWMCYVSTFIIGLGILLRKSNWVLSQFFLLAIPVAFWNIDFFYHLITQSSLWGITDYLFVGGFSLGDLFSLQHLFSIPASIYAISLLGLNTKNSLKISFIQIVLIYFATLLISTPAENANCVYEPCINFLIGTPYYPLIWFFGYALIISISYYPVKNICSKIACNSNKNL